MREACIRAVEARLGRPLRANEAADIEARVLGHMRRLAMRNPEAWAAKPEAERLTEGGKVAADELEAEALRRKNNIENRILRLQAIDDFVTRQVRDGKAELHLDALDRVLAPRADAGGVLEGGALDQRAQGIYADAVRNLMDLFEAGKRRGIWRFIPFNEPGVDRMVRRALAGDTKGLPPEFVNMAKLAHDYIDVLRRRFNAAGGHIGHLDDWGEPHRWSDNRLIKAIKKQGREAVVQEFADAANRGRYINPDGSRMTPEDIYRVMDGAIQSILTDGASERVRNPEDASPFAQSLIANRHGAHREIHLRSDMAERMLNKYSELGAMSSLLMHMHQLARDVALVETFGANSDLTWKTLLERAYDRDVAAFPERKDGLLGLKNKKSQAERLYNYLAGHEQGQRNAFGAGLGFIRSLATFKALGFTVWSSLTDPVIMQHVAAARGLDQGKLWVADVKHFMGGGRRWAKRAGLITDTVAGYAQRVSIDHLSAPELGSRAASFTVKVTGLNWVTEARRAAYGRVMMDALGHLVRNNESIETLRHADDQALVRMLNVNENTWKVWRMAKLETLGDNNSLLSPQAIDAIPDAEIRKQFPHADPALVRQDAVTQLLGIVKDELNTAIITPGSRESATLRMGTQAGTFGGELIRAITLFKSFPFTFLSRQAELSRSLGGGANMWRYRASMMVSLWITGAMIVWIYDLLNGRDPTNMNPETPEGRRGLVAALMRGGGLGFYGDFLFANIDPNSSSQSLASGLGGPVTGMIDELQALGPANLAQSAIGEEPNFGPEAARFAGRQIPNWWMTKALTDHYIVQALQEEMQPGYNRRRTQQALHRRGTSYFWTPGSPLEDARAPDFSRIVESDKAPPRPSRRQ